MTTIDKLTEEYSQANLHPRKTKLVTEQEADAAFIRFRNTFWSVLFFVIFAISILLPGVIGE